MNREKSRKDHIVVLIAAVFAAAMVIFPQTTEAGSKTAISLWLNSIVPVMLPFYIFSDFIKRTGDLSRLPVRIYPFVMAFLSGYPMAAKVTGDIVKSGAITTEQGRHIQSYSFVTGPAFIIFTVGDFIGSQKAAVVIAVSHYMGALLNGLLYPCAGPAPVRKSLREAPGGHYLENFTAAIIGGFRAMAVILAYIMVFIIGINILESSGVFGMLPCETASAALKGIFEMTIGDYLIGMCNTGIRIKTLICAFLVSFGGLSVAGQAVSVAGGSSMGLGDILKIKLTHGLIGAVIAMIFGWFVL